jgi:UDP-N-acetyl-D-glucosamine dehydrogenase
MRIGAVLPVADKADHPVDGATMAVSTLEQLYNDKKAKVGIIGMGYVGMPLALTAATAGFAVVGFDIDAEKVVKINAGKSYIKHITSEDIAALTTQNRLRATNLFEQVRDVDAIIICVPTPLTSHREPDLRFVQNTTEVIAPHVRRDHLIVLESTTWPGTTREVVKPILENCGLKSGRDFYLAYSPEREDPGNPDFSTRNIPKVVGGDDSISLRLAQAFYSALGPKTIAVSSAKAAEAVKLTENIFRAVNIALVNELKIVYDAMGIDIWEIVEAAKTKPFGFMPFYPGPGLGGHCVPIDPFYLTWKAREFEISTRFIELAGEINASMPHYVVNRLTLELDRRTGRGLRGTNILIAGVAYKKNVDDTRESPAFKLMELIEGRGARTAFYDPYVPVIPSLREHRDLSGRRSIGALNRDILADFDAVLISTDHDDIDYASLCRHSKLVVDTRNACARAGVVSDNVIKA